VDEKSFADAVLVLFGHGSTVNVESSAPVLQHVAELRRRRIFAEVREAFWKQDPRLTELLPELAAPQIFLLPFFISEGYFSDQVIPRELGFHSEAEGDSWRVQRRGAQTLVYCRPVGSHPRMTDVLLARARGVVERFPFPRAPLPKDTTLFIAGHGTEQNENSRVAIERQVELLKAMNLYAAVEGVFLEEPPRIPDCYQIAQTRNVVVVPFFISDGMHVREDIPVLLGEPARLVKQRLESGRPTWRNPTEKNGRLVWYAPAVGTEPLLAEVIVERAREAASWIS
jgi:sirohydrochlorin cobaltochelatase